MTKLAMQCYKPLMNFNRATLYGESIFTSFRTYGGKVPGLNHHLERFFKSVNETFFNERLHQGAFYEFYLPQGIQFDANNDYYYRLTFVPEAFKTNLGLSEGRVFLRRENLSPVKEKLRLALAPFPLGSGASVDKAGSYFFHLKAKRQALKQGYDDVLFFNEQGVCEASTSAVVFKRNSTYSTPDFFPALPSVTLKLFESYLQSQGLALSREFVAKPRLSSMDAIFLLNAVQGIRSVVQISDFSYDEDDRDLIGFKNFLEKTP